MTLQTVVVPIASLLVLILPGLAVGVLAGLRPAVALVTAPLTTYGITTATATTAASLPIPWNALSLLVATAVVALAVLLLRVLTTRGSGWRGSVRLERPDRPSWRDGIVVGGVLAGGALSAGVLLSGFGRLAAPNQDWDYVFHANAVRFLADTGDLAPTALRVVNDWESADFYYPHTFHALAAVVAQLTGATPFEALNAQAMLMCLIAGAGLAMLLRRAGAPLAVTAVTPLILAGFASFPYDVLWRGPLLPFAAGVAVIPAFLVTLDVMLRNRRPGLVLVAGLGAAGLLGLHPSTALSAGLVVLVYLGFRWAAPGRTPGRDVLLLVAAGASAILAAFPAVQGALLKTTGGGWVQDWPAVMSPGQAVGDLFLLNHGAPAPQYWLAGLLIVGLLALHRAPYLWWWVGASVVAITLFVLSAASDTTFVTDLTAPWWNDRWRFAAIAVLGLAPLAAHGLLSLATLAAAAVRRLLGARAGRLSSRGLTGAMVAAGLVLLVLLSQGLYAPSNKARIAANYQQDATLDARETAAMAWLAERSQGGTVMNDPNDGSAYLSAVAGLRPLFGHVVNPSAHWLLGDTQQLLLDRFNCLDSDPRVRRAIEDLDVRYVFLGSGFVRDDMNRVPGLVGIGTSESLELVHQTTGVRIYEVDLTSTPVEPVPACGREESDGGAAG